MENTRHIKSGEKIITEETLTDSAYIILSGSAKVTRTLKNGDEKLIGILMENDIFGEMSMIDSLPRSANVEALEDCTVAIVTQEMFQSLYSNNPNALMPLIKVLTRRLRESLNIIECLQNQKTLASN